MAESLVHVLNMVYLEAAKLFIFTYKFFLGLVVGFSVKRRVDCRAGIDRKTKQDKNQQNES